MRLMNICSVCVDNNQTTYFMLTPSINIREYENDCEYGRHVDLLLTMDDYYSEKVII